MCNIPPVGSTFCETKANLRDKTYMCNGEDCYTRCTQLSTFFLERQYPLVSDAVTKSYFCHPPASSYTQTLPRHWRPAHTGHHIPCPQLGGEKHHFEKLWNSTAGSRVGTNLPGPTFDHVQEGHQLERAYTFCSPCCRYLHEKTWHQTIHAHMWTAVVSTVFHGPAGSVTAHPSLMCQSFNLVYIISCSHCSQLYVGETYQKPNERFTEHLWSVRLSYNTSVATHFNTHPDHISHMSVAAVWQNASRSTCRKHAKSQLISPPLHPPASISVKKIPSLLFSFLYACLACTPA